jgi:catechol 2,3-dioxygenase-like lactoylglutathione lyase family enzyme
LADYNTTPKITRTSFVIAVPDLEVSAAFYRDVLGFTIHSISDARWRFYTPGDCNHGWVLFKCDSSSKLGDHSHFASLEIDDMDTFY